MRIAFSGLTAAGKTTHSKLLAASLGVEWLGATEILASLAGYTGVVESLFNGPGAAYIESAREGDALDRELDRRILDRVTSRADIVVDAWALPWLYQDPDLVRIWLESDCDSRTRKCYVSQGSDVTRDMPGCLELITAKDESTRARFLRMYRFDLMSDHEQFDVKLTNAHLIPTATRSCADFGIATFEPVLEAAVRVATDACLPGDREFLTGQARDCVVRVRGLSDVIR